MRLPWSQTRPANDASFMAGVMGTAAYLGERSHFYVNVEGLEQSVAVSAQNQNRMMTAIDESSQPVWLQWNEDAIVVLTDA